MTGWCRVELAGSVLSKYCAIHPIRILLQQATIRNFGGKKSGIWDRKATVKRLEPMMTMTMMMAMIIIVMIDFVVERCCSCLQSLRRGRGREKENAIHRRLESKWVRMYAAWMLYGALRSSSFVTRLGAPRERPSERAMAARVKCQF